MLALPRREAIRERGRRPPRTPISGGSLDIDRHEATFAFLLNSVGSLSRNANDRADR
jgi:hypothetical protein